MGMFNEYKTPKAKQMIHEYGKVGQAGCITVE